MSIFMKAKRQEQETTVSAKSARPLSRQPLETAVSPFTCQDQTFSPAPRRVDSSPLQIPLTLAIRKLFSKNEERAANIGEGGSFFCEKKLDWSQFSEMDSVGEGVNVSQMANLKNILQEFIESLYCEVERQIYSKFNVEMKRMIITFRQTQKLLKTLQQKLTLNVDVIELEKQQRVKERLSNQRIEELRRSMNILQSKLSVYESERQSQLKQMALLKAENQKLSFHNQKYENILLMQLQQISNSNSFSSNSVNIRDNSQSNRRFQTFTNLLATKNNDLVRREVSHHQFGLQLSSSQIENINKLPPTFSPICNRKGKGQRATLQTKRQPLGSAATFQPIKRRIF